LGIKTQFLKFSVVIFLITNGFCFGFQNERAKTDSLYFYLEKKNAIKALSYAHYKSNEYLIKKDYINYCDIILKKAELYEKFNDKENALKVLYEARDIAEKNNLTEKKALIYSYIGAVNFRMFEYTKAKKYLNKAENIALKLKKEKLLISVYQTLFNLHFDTESDSAYYFLTKINFYSNNAINLDLQYKNQANYAQYYSSIKDFYNAKKHLDSSYNIALKTKNIKYITSAKNDLGLYFINVEKNYQKGKQEYLDILTMFPKKDDPNTISNAYLNLSNAYEKMGDYKNAYLYNNKYLEIFEDVINGRLSQSTQEIENKYAIDKIENQFKEKERKVEDKQDRNQKLLLLFASLFILAGFIFYFYYQNLLLKQKNKIKDIDANLQYKIISATLDGQDKERNKISGVLHDNVSAILSSVGLHLSAFESSLTKEQIQDLKKTRSLLKDAHDKVRDLSHELVPPLLVKLGLQYALKDLCEKNSNSLLNFIFFSTLPDDRRFNSDFETKMYFIVSELLNNVIKHSKASESVLSIEENEGHLHLIIEDNGTGFNVENANKTNGFGITQIRARIKNMHGEIKIKSKLSEGTIIAIRVTT
jgi:signal transduction histidine kinase